MNRDVVTYINDVKLEKLVGIDVTERPFEGIAKLLGGMGGDRKWRLPDNKGHAHVTHVALHKWECNFERDHNNNTHVTATGELEQHKPNQPLPHGSPLPQFVSADVYPAAAQKSVSAVICAVGVVATTLQRGDNANSATATNTAAAPPGHDTLVGRRGVSG